MERIASLQFREAGKDDLPWIISLYNQTIPSRIVTADTTPVSVESRHAWFESHTPSTPPLLLVELRNQGVIGWVSFQDFYGRPAYQATAEISIYIHADFRKKGYGHAILEQCCRMSDSLGIRHLIGFIFAENLPSLRLFERVGFERWELLPNLAVLDGVEKSLCILGKRLGGIQ